MNGSFKSDIVSLLPFDAVYILYGIIFRKPYYQYQTLLRIPRLLKFGDFQEFFRRLGKISLETCTSKVCNVHQSNPPLVDNTFNLRTECTHITG